jgi:hypothetical protein
MTKTTALPFVNKYSLVARIYPAIIALVPWFILTIGLAGSELGKLVDNVLSLQVAGCVALNVAAFFLLVQINRFIGKEVFEGRIFNDELNMPTTLMLLATTNESSSELLQKLSKQTEKDFGLSLPTFAEVTQDEMRSRRRIVEIVAQIRQKVRDGHLLLQHNIEYGFTRNLIGGAPLALIVSVVDVFYYRTKSSAVVILSLAMVLGWALLLVISKPVIQRFGRLYAKRLVQEYIGGEVS